VCAFDSKDARRRLTASSELTRGVPDTQTPGFQRGVPDTQTPGVPDTQTPGVPDTQTPRGGVPDTQTPRGSQTLNPNSD
jgi:hypothetical protein